MTAESIHRILKPEEGETLKLGPPMAGQLVMKVHAEQAGAGFVVGMQTLLPRSLLPVHRYLQHDAVVFIHKGQGRAMVDGRSVTVVPGAILHVPKGVWCGLQNNGTGALQFVWTLVPSGAEQFFREYAALSAPADDATLQALALRYGIEVRTAQELPGGVTAAHEGRRHRRRHRGRGRPKQQPVAQPQTTEPPVAQASQSVSPGVLQLPSAPVQPVPVVSPAARPVGAERHGAPHQRRRAHPPRQKPASPAGQPRPEGTAPQGAPGRRREEDHRHHGRIKEVYMGGRWVRVAGDGPVIAPGR